MRHDEGQMGNVIDYKDARVWLPNSPERTQSARGSVNPAWGRGEAASGPGSAPHVPYLDWLSYLTLTRMVPSRIHSTISSLFITYFLVGVSFRLCLLCLR